MRNSRSTMPTQRTSRIPLRKGWPHHVKSSVLHVISLAHFSVTQVRGWAANSINARVRLAAENDSLKQEVQRLREELRIKDARMAKIDPRRRPYYPPTERMAILELKAARGWSLAETARAFLVQPETIAAWLRRADEGGPSALVQLRQPVNGVGLASVVIDYRLGVRLAILNTARADLLKALALQ